MRWRRLFPPGFKRLGYIYLLQLLIPTFYLSFLQDWQHVILGAFLLLVLAVTYILTWWVSYRKFVFLTAVEIILMLLMGAVLSPGFLSVLFWPAAAIARFSSRRERFIGLAILIGSGLLEVVILAHFRHASLAPWWPMIFAGIAAAIFTVVMVQWQTEMYRSRTALKLANEEVERLSKLAERNRISQDLHDVLGHELAMITLKAQLAERLVEKDQARARVELHDIQEASRRTLSQVREYIAQIRTPNLDEEWEAAAKLLGAAGIHCTMQGTVHNFALPESTAQALAMSLRESVTNIVKHSRARTATLRIEQWQDDVVIMVSDDGKGIAKVETHGDGHGLSGVTGRLSAVNGKLGLWSRHQWLSPWQPAHGVNDLMEKANTILVLQVPRSKIPSQSEVIS